MKITADWLMDRDLQRLLGGLTAAGFAAYAVGGCVRNTLMSLPISDVDLASSAPPDQVMRLAKTLGYRAIPTGIDHGTVTVVCPRATYEVTTFRRDIATDGRHAKVAFSQDVAEDAARRDFTINALYVDAAGTVLDPVRGMDDIAARRVRFVGDAADRIAEDYLRILRFFRFSAHYADQALGFDGEVLAACAAHLDGIVHLSKERIGQEMRKLLVAQDPAPAVAAMAQIGVLHAVLPGADPRCLAPLVHVEMGHAPHPITRLAVLGGLDAAAALRLSKKETALLAVIRAALGSSATPAALGWSHGADIATQILFARAAVMEQPLPTHWQAETQRGAMAVCPVTAADFMPALQGPDLGRALNAATARWLHSDLTLSKSALLQ